MIQVLLHNLYSNALCHFFDSLQVKSFGIVPLFDLNPLSDHDGAYSFAWLHAEDMNKLTDSDGFFLITRKQTDRKSIHLNEYVCSTYLHLKVLVLLIQSFVF